MLVLLLMIRDLLSLNVRYESLNGIIFVPDQAFTLFGFILHDFFCSILI